MIQGIEPPKKIEKICLWSSNVDFTMLYNKRIVDLMA